MAVVVGRWGGWGWKRGFFSRKVFLYQIIWNILTTFIILLGFLISFIWEWAETKLWNRSTFIYNWWHLNCLLGNWRTNRWWSTSRTKIYSVKKNMGFYLNGLFSGERPKLKTCSEFFENPGGSWLFWGIDFSSVWFWLWGFTVEVEDVWIIFIKLEFWLIDLTFTLSSLIVTLFGNILAKREASWLDDREGFGGDESSSSFQPLSSRDCCGGACAAGGARFDWMAKNQINILLL